MGIIETTNMVAGALRRTWRNAGAPTDGTSGSFAGQAEKGDLLVDSTNGGLYQNTNTQASPTWTQLAASGAALSTDVADMAAAGTSTGNTLGAGTTAAPIDHVHALGAHDHSGATTGGDLGVVKMTAGTAPDASNVYLVHDNSGDLTLNALTGKAVHLAVAGSDIMDVDGSGVSITGNLDVSGTLGLTGDWTISGQLTVDELVLDTDGSAPGATNCYAVRDNSGDFTVNAITGKQFHVAIAGSDEYDFSATVLDMNGNALDNAGYVILNAATAPAGTEVYAVNDNSGDLTLNALNTKSVHIAVAGADEYDFSATAAAFGANNLTFTTGQIQISGAGAVDLGSSGYIEFGATPASAGVFRIANNTYALSARNAGNAADVDMIKVNASDVIEFGASLAATTLAGTLSMADQGIDFTTGYIEFGTTPADSGDIRQENNTAVWAARNAGDDGNISGWKVNASDDYEAAADVNMGENTLYGSTAAHTADTADGSLYLESTTNATKGFVCIPNGDLGLVVGSDGSVDRGTAVGDNAVHIFDGAAAPSGTLANGITLYSEGGECKVLDAAGNSTTLSPHTADGDYIIHSYSAAKDETVTIHLEKLAKALATGEFAKFVEVTPGHLKKAKPVK